MANTPAGGIVSTVARAAAIRTVATSFVFEDLIFHIQAIQQQIIEIAKVIDERQKTKSELKSRSFTFIDPYGNSIVNTYMDHEMIDTILEKYKKDYVPKYLQKWIKIGTRNEDGISPLGDGELKSTVSEYADGHQFIAYGEMTFWVGKYEYSSPRMIILRVLVTDNIKKIKKQLKEEKQITNIQLKSILGNQNAQSINSYWNEGKTLKKDDTIMSCQLYQDNCIIMAKYIDEKVNGHFFLLTLHYFIFPTEKCCRFHAFFRCIFEKS
jgi:hypothetical protein